MKEKKSRIKVAPILVSAVCLLIIVARIIWPKITFDDISLWLFGIGAISLLVPNIGELISRIRKIKRGETEIEFARKISQLQEETERFEQEASSKDLALLLPTDISEHIRSEIEKNISNPRAALIALALEIEKTIKMVAQEYNISIQGRFFSARRVLEELSKEGIISKFSLELFMEFWSIRNQAIHSIDFQPSKEELYKLVDLGVRILRILIVRLP